MAINLETERKLETTQSWVKVEKQLVPPRFLDHRLIVLAKELDTPKRKTVRKILKKLRTGKVTR